MKKQKRIFGLEGVRGLWSFLGGRLKAEVTGAGLVIGVLILVFFISEVDGQRVAHPTVPLVACMYKKSVVVVILNHSEGSFRAC